MDIKKRGSYHTSPTLFIIEPNNGKYKKEVVDYIDTQDILPTILNLFGIEYRSNMYIGTDAFSNNHDNYVYFSNGSYVGKNKISTKIINQKIRINDLIIKNNYKF